MEELKPCPRCGAKRFEDEGEKDAETKSKSQ